MANMEAKEFLIAEFTMEDQTEFLKALLQLSQAMDYERLEPEDGRLAKAILLQAAKELRGLKEQKTELLEALEAAVRIADRETIEI